ncbi:MAG: RNA polymerase sigma factor [Saprospiraceae bacterium]|nr:RNA polymerase sigma factor [Saprospiraceae bacterium]
MPKESNYSEAELVAGCVRNDRVFQEALYRRYFHVMMKMCRRYTTDPEIAMTVCNDGFLKVYKKIESFAFKGSLEGWIRRIVYHSISDYFRKDSKYVQFMVFEDHDDATNPDIVPGLYLEDLMKLIAKLPTMSEKVFRLYAIEGFNHREIGETLGMSENTSKWHLANARKKLQDLLNDQRNQYVQKNS